MLVDRRHYQVVECAHFLVKQANCIIFRVVGPETVGADHLCQSVAFVRGGHVTAAPHFAQAYLEPGACQLPGGLGPGEPATDDMDVVIFRHCEQSEAIHWSDSWIAAPSALAMTPILH